MIIEKVIKSPMAPPSNNQRWDAVKELYRVLRNLEPSLNTVRVKQPC